MRYVALDIETTGLDPDKHQILEIAAVCDDLSGETWSPKVFHAYLQHDEIVGQPHSLVMNAKIIRAIQRGQCEDDAIITTSRFLMLSFRAWLDEHHLRRKHITFAGKNVANFDLRFLRNLWDWGLSITEHHRTIDPGILYMRRGDDEVPGLKECLHRAGLSVTGEHRAIDDAVAVVRLIRRHFDQQPGPGGPAAEPGHHAP